MAPYKQKQLEKNVTLTEMLQMFYLKGTNDTNDTKFWEKGFKKKKKLMKIASLIIISKDWTPIHILRF